MSARTLAQVYRHFAEADAAGTSPLYERVAIALPVVITTGALSRFPLESRLRFRQRLDAAATSRPVAWVSVEGVGVAPAVPTFGDRCWSRGRLLAWLAGT
ncbi:MAG TPA: DUF2332 family protein [Streptosporangiaceae bacterium]|nr:DUF2332 family protein [Streptosporangiaceae bacterium]